MFHSDAMRAFDVRASDLWKLIQEFSTLARTHETTPLELHPSASIGPSDISGEISESLTDYRGIATTRFFRDQGKRYGYTQANYAIVHQLVESIRRNPKISARLSRSYVENKLFEWSRIGFKHQGHSDRSFCSFLQDAASNDVREHQLWIPIANLHVVESIPFGGVEIRPITKLLMDVWEQKFLDEYPGDRAKAEQYYPRLRTKFQGYAAVFTRIVAEPERAFERALEQAERITTFLAVFSIGALAPDIRCISVVKGSEHVRQASIFMTERSESAHLWERALDHAEMRPWILNREEIERLRRIGFDELSHLLCVERPNDFQRALLSALALYAKAAFAREAVDKIVYALASLESLLLKDKREPIQQNLGERMAFFVSQDGLERREIIDRVRRAYGMRSDYLHHGENEEQREGTKDFLLRVWAFYMQVLANWNLFQTRAEFVSAIDDVKLGIFRGHVATTDGTDA